MCVHCHRCLICSVPAALLPLRVQPSDIPFPVPPTLLSKGVCPSPLRCSTWSPLSPLQSPESLSRRSPAAACSLRGLRHHLLTSSFPCSVPVRAVATARACHLAAHGVGAPKLAALCTSLAESTSPSVVPAIVVANGVDEGELNCGCGAEHVQKARLPPKHFEARAETRPERRCGAAVHARGGWLCTRAEGWGGVGGVSRRVAESASECRLPVICQRGFGKTSLRQRLCDSRTLARQQAWRCRV
eukprot:5963536-Pleurochrysis_carterae.AAC.4